ncbi:major capsid protein [Shewanella sp. GD04112]|uniref:major capsid protein n=1 Tax=Shewanella sp. GD04112 TaxID=2975434 RepID=UPI002449D0CE|nr:major capsid protein [Shewanella sp. GD04112]MDH0448711.1 major capsid protein [Shewanella sp. GD04112]MDH0448722.1 major capsid protein [Shewanella sp. GD04112]
MKKYLVSAVALGSAVAASSASAAIDVTAATTAITTDGSAALTAVGGAMLGLAAIAVVFKWAKGAIFG